MRQGKKSSLAKANKNHSLSLAKAVALTAATRVKVARISGNTSRNQSMIIIRGRRPLTIGSSHNRRQRDNGIIWRKPPSLLVRNSSKRHRNGDREQRSKTIGIALRTWVIISRTWAIISKTWAKVRTSTKNGLSKIHQTSKRTFSLLKISSMNSKTSKTKGMETRKESWECYS